ncbi:MAG: tRNA (guanosine(37)-N1)-methyltransferase TrmD [Propionicimonas sp.]|nr:tRNA (guanosine(37)-N1)-methyltransferase TrmD [Propionicimonas sp.]
MRLDLITIFPDYFAPLQLSLVGKAIASGLVSLGVHDLRDWTHDRHRTVDDTPYGGGAGMVMKPEPWGEALDAVVPQAQRPVLVVPTPSGVRFSQALAHDLAGRDWLVFACGRYEGIDARVVEHAATRMDVLEVSLGDYVLNGGEVAALAMVEAVVRLLPGVLGNPESLAEESHGDELAGLLEYPVFTKPAQWRGLEVPAVLLSGHHQQVANWRAEQSLARTRARRPDLLEAKAEPDGTGLPDRADAATTTAADGPEG